MSSTAVSALTSPVAAKLAEVTALETQLAALRKEANDERVNVLKTIHADLGYENVDDLIKALRSVNSKGSKRPAARKARASITPDKRAAIIADLTAGKAPLDVANTHSISLATVQNIKKAAGLVKARGTDAPASA